MDYIKAGDFVIVKNNNGRLTNTKGILVGFNSKDEAIIEEDFKGNLEIIPKSYTIVKQCKAKEDAIIEIRALIKRTSITQEELTERTIDLFKEKSPS